MAVANRLRELRRATAGAVGFCTRVPLGNRERDWEAFCRFPEGMVLVAYLVGILGAVPLLVGLPSATAIFLFPIWLYTVTGITHLDGLADLGDAVAVHGDPSRRRDVMRDSTVGVGAVAAVVLVVFGLAMAAWELSRLHWQATVATILTAEVGAKFAVVALIALGEPTHEGLGSALSETAGGTTLLAAVAFAAPALGVGFVASTVTPGAILATAGGALGGGAVVFVAARELLGGVSGDVFGATNEIARVAGLHAGVVVWAL